MSKASRKDLKSALILALQLAERGVDGLPVPGVKAGISGILKIIEQADLRAANEETFADLVGLIKKFHTVTVKQLPNNGNIADDLENAVRVLAEDLEDIPAQYNERIGERSTMRRLRSVILAKEDAEALNNLGKRLKNSIDIFQSALLMSLRVGQLKPDIPNQLADMKHETDRLIDKLAVERKAFYNAHRERPIELCQPGTRVSLLQNVTTWTDDIDSQILWLNGRAGVGKSTIAKTLATRFDDAKTLGGSFMFSRANGVTDGSKVCATLAHQLAGHLPEFRDRLAAAVRDNANSIEAEIPHQFNNILAAPLSLLQSPPLTVIILDALDECSPETLKLMLTSICEISIQFRFLRIIITSRPEHSIRQVLQRFKEHIHEEDLNVISVSDDIDRYLRAQLSDAYTRIVGDANPNQAWPAEPDLAVLLEIAGNLFIFAATAVRFIGDERAAEPQRRLELVLRGQPARQKHTLASLDVMYQEILQNALRDGDNNLYDRFQDVVGTIVFSEFPYSVNSLMEILAPKYSANDIRNSLKYLYSVLIVPEDANELGVQVYHKSFADFITDYNRCTLMEAYLHSLTHHERLCLRQLEIAESRFDALLATTGNSGDKQAVDCRGERQALIQGIAVDLMRWLYHLRALTDQAKKDDKTRIILLVQHRAEVLSELSMECHIEMGADGLTKMALNIIKRKLQDGIAMCHNRIQPTIW